jgi:integrase
VTTAVDFVFTTGKGAPLHGARRAFERVCRQAELGAWGPPPERTHTTGPLPVRPFTPAFRIYDLRHSYVTLLLMHGVPVNVVADLAGHEQASFTIARYGHALPKQVTQATETVQRVLFGTA